VFSNAAIRSALEVTHGGQSDDIVMPLLDRQGRIGVGRSAGGGYVLMVPGQPAVRNIAGELLSFSPWETVRVQSGELIPDVALVTCDYPNATPEEIEALSLVFEALMNQAIYASDESAAGRTVHSLFTLFENRLALSISREKEVGIIGELLVLASARDIDFLVDAWHVDPTDRYDFSCGSDRLEVKTTTGGRRIHHFSGVQFPALPGLHLDLVSIQLDEVGIGTGVADLFEEIATRLSDPLQVEKFRSKCVDVLSADPRMVRSVQVDRIRADESIQLFWPVDVPTPEIVEGILSIEWRAELTSAGRESSKSQIAIRAGLSGSEAL
jgi:hypothetical protein